MLLVRVSIYPVHGYYHGKGEINEKRAGDCIRDCRIEKPAR